MVVTLHKLEFQPQIQKEALSLGGPLDTSQKNLG